MPEVAAAATQKAVPGRPLGKRASPNGIRATPNGIRATPNRIRATPSGIRASPNGIRATPNGIWATPNRIRASPNGIRASPSGIRATPNGIRASPVFLNCRTLDLRSSKGDSLGDQRATQQCRIDTVDAQNGDGGFADRHFAMQRRASTTEMIVPSVGPVG